MNLKQALLNGKYYMLSKSLKRDIISTKLEIQKDIEKAKKELIFIENKIGSIKEPRVGTIKKSKL